MTLKILEKPSILCGNCIKDGDKCHCLCHVKPYIDSYHEVISNYPGEIKVENVTKFESEYTLFDKLKKRLGFSVWESLRF